MLTKDHARIETMKYLRDVGGKTLQEIADIYGVSRERIRQIIGNTGLVAGKMKFEKRVNFISSHANLTNSQISEEIGLPKTQVAHYRFGARHKLSDGAVKRGAEAEDYISNILDANNINHKLMPHHNRFDILLENGKRVDVKAAYKIGNSPSLYRGRYNFKIMDIEQADYYICIIMETKDIFIIPASEIPKNSYKVAFPWPPKNKRSKYKKYHNNFDLLK